jgi:hypothetical protein
MKSLSIQLCFLVALFTLNLAFPLLGRDTKEQHVLDKLVELCESLKSEWDTLEEDVKDMCYLTYLSHADEAFDHPSIAGQLKKRFFQLEVGKEAISPSNGGNGRSNNVFKYGRK